MIQLVRRTDRAYGSPGVFASPSRFSVRMRTPHSGGANHDVVAREWNDSIIPAFENGAWVIRKRFDDRRVEQMENFALLYARALSMRENPAWWDYPVPKGPIAALLGATSPSVGETGSVGARQLECIRRTQLN